MQHSAPSDLVRLRNYNELVKAAEKICRIDPGKWFPVKSSSDNIWYMDIYNWVKANGCDSNDWKYSYTHEMIFFKHEADALAFKLRFGHDGK